MIHKIPLSSIYQVRPRNPHPVQERGREDDGARGDVPQDGRERGLLHHPGRMDRLCPEAHHGENELASQGEGTLY